MEKRVTSIKILSMYYSDSDDEATSPSTSNNRRKSRNDVEEGELGELVAPAESALSDWSRTAVSSPPRKIPRQEESESHPEHEAAHHDPARPRRTSEWASDDEALTERDFAVPPSYEESLKEPPPPARPDDFRACSPSPAGATRSPTPATARGGRLPGGGSSTTLEPKAPRRVDSQALVSYDAPEDEEAEAERRASKEHDCKMESAPTVATTIADLDGDGSADMSDKTSENTPSATAVSADEELDSYALLEKSLEKGGNVVDDASAVSEAEIELPPSPKEKCDPDLVDKFAEYMRQKRRHRRDFNAQIQLRKDFRNPSIYEKLIEHFQLDELGSNFEPSLFDPHTTDYYEELSKAQRIMMDKLEKDTKSTASAGKDTGLTADDIKRRRSKWDNPAVAKDVKP